MCARVCKLRTSASNNGATSARCTRDNRRTISEKACERGKYLQRYSIYKSLLYLCFLYAFNRASYSVIRTSRNTLVVHANAYRGVLRDVRVTLCRPIECIQKTELLETFVNTVICMKRLFHFAKLGPISFNGHAESLLLCQGQWMLYTIHKMQHLKLIHCSHLTCLKTVHIIFILWPMHFHQSWSFVVKIEVQFPPSTDWQSFSHIYHTHPLLSCTHVHRKNYPTVYYMLVLNSIINLFSEQYI